MLWFGIDPVQSPFQKGTFLNFPGASSEICLRKIVSAVMSAEWSNALMSWAFLVGQRLGQKGQLKMLKPLPQGRPLPPKSSPPEKVDNDRIGQGTLTSCNRLELRDLNCIY